LEVSLADHCNLNCIGCASFSNIAEKKFLDIEIFERDAARIAELTNGRIEMLNLLGGEPLLNRQIIDFMKISRRYFQAGIINITTNGVLLSGMAEDFWNACGKYSVQISITKYPINLNMDLISRRAHDHNVKLQYWNGNTIKTMWKIPFDLDGRREIMKSFRLCVHANRCAPLVNGKIYACPPCAHIEYFNNLFNTSLKTSEKDCIDIYAVKSAGEIYDFLCKPVPFCRFCKTDKTNFGIKWSVSKRSISEWT
jgi:MoaA/NifB/PqqE/SkfB family radical SAM enzyme